MADVNLSLLPDSGSPLPMTGVRLSEAPTAVYAPSGRPTYVVVTDEQELIPKPEPVKNLLQIPAGDRGGATAAITVESDTNWIKLSSDNAIAITWQRAEYKYPEITAKTCMLSAGIAYSGNPYAAISVYRYRLSDNGDVGNLGTLKQSGSIKFTIPTGYGALVRFYYTGSSGTTGAATVEYSDITVTEVVT